MIVTRIIGGLGNQLFQYAYGSYLANKANTDHFIDLRAFADYDVHPLAIDRFTIKAKQFTPEMCDRLPAKYRQGPRWRNTIRQFARTAMPGAVKPLSRRSQRPFGFDTRYMQPDNDLYVDGYWQSESFFPGMRSQLRRELTLRSPLSQASQRVADQMQSVASVALHVRRGDYVSNPANRNIFRCLEADYYRRCLEDLCQHVANTRVYLFSNDIPWCIEHLNVGIPMTPVAHNDVTTAHEDMFLMSRCQHAIIANSSFSWWAAYLACENRNRRVYYPQPWFCPGSLDGSAIGCDDWIGEQQLGTQASRAA